LSSIWTEVQLRFVALSRVRLELNLWLDLKH